MGVMPGTATVYDIKTARFDWQREQGRIGDINKRILAQRLTIAQQRDVSQSRRCRRALQSSDSDSKPDHSRPQDFQIAAGQQPLWPIEFESW